jgi:succinate dehydrogenase / fumarate reductase, iron-sulfur subunit
LESEILRFAQNDIADYMNFRLRVWRQPNPQAKGKLVSYEARDISPDTSFLEMLDIVNDELTTRGEEPIAFDSDCREGICGTCSLTINGEAHGPRHPAAACQLYMRSFREDEIITIEPFRVKSFPLVRDLVVDRRALDRVVQAGGFISARAGAAPEANSILVPKHDADRSMEAAACIGCGACAAACPNASAMLFTAAKVSHLAFLPQGVPERTSRVLRMVRQMDEEGFGNCTNTYECEAVCPAEISASFISKLNREYAHALWRERFGE